MAVTPDDTVSGSDSNTYILIAFADIYFEPDPTFFVIWDALTDDEKNEKLLFATQALDRLNFIGEKADVDQALQFPRNISEDFVRNPYTLPDVTEIPDEVNRAQCEMIKLQHYFAGSTDSQQAQEIMELEVINGLVKLKYSEQRPKGDVMFGANVDSINALLRFWLIGEGFVVVSK